MIINKYCPECVKNGTCMWEDKLSKLNGTEKKPINLNITVDGCDEYLPSDGEKDEE